jgi:hypothetical protein
MICLSVYLSLRRKEQRLNEGGEDNEVGIVIYTSLMIYTLAKYSILS